MIAKGTTHNNGAKLAAYMSKSKDGERAEVWQVRGFEATNIKDAFRDVEIMAGATKCEQPFFHVQVRNREGESLTTQQWEHAADRIESILGLTGQPRAITFHTYDHNDDKHMHIAWSRIDEETMRARALPFFKERLKTISRELEVEFGLLPVQNEREGPIKFAPTRAQDEQARRLGLDVHELRNTIRACWDRSDCGASFLTALEQEGFTLALGDRGKQRNYVAVDQGGGLHALSKRILDISAAGIRERLSDLDANQLLSVEQAQDMMRDASRGREQEPSSLDRMKRELAEIDALIGNPVWDREGSDRAWQEAVIKAAIEKEKIAQEFVEPEAREAHPPDHKAEAGSREKERVSAERPLSAGAAAIRLAYGASHSPQAFARNLHEGGNRLARATAEEAERSHRNAAFARAIGRFAPEYREGEYVAINDSGQVFSLNRRTTGESREDIDAFMRTYDGTKTKGIEATLEDMAAYKRPTPARELWERDALTPWQSFGYAAQEVRKRDSAPQHMRGPSADIWTAYKRSDTARAFVAALQERDITLAVVTRDDANMSQVQRHYASELTTPIPPKLREGDYVAITEDGRIYNLNWRTTGESADRVQKFMATLDKAEFQSVGDVLKAVQERADVRDIERRAFRDLSARQVKVEWERDPRPTGRHGNNMAGSVAVRLKGAAALEKAATRTIGAAFDVVGDAVESLFAPPLTPERKREGEQATQQREGEQATQQREVEGDRAIDFAQFTGELAAQRRQQESDRALERQDDERQRGGRDR